MARRSRKWVSKAQQAWSYAAEKRGQLRAGTAHRKSKSGAAYRAMPRKTSKRK